MRWWGETLSGRGRSFGAYPRPKDLPTIIMSTASCGKSLELRRRLLVRPYASQGLDGFCTGGVLTHEKAVRRRPRVCVRDGLCMAPTRPHPFLAQCVDP